ncbi:uncharacterized protein EV422DRAFT_258773 [Fimicolochytrium jonesii]|uniref:uncharacterized protein n=1 Tax=Fimicolochytrium jonesii TaxID=1396493 RepID=UPI0022FE1A39|nr:uncharacterized protein EV422DRAFT_258773 [Fimicolochytrium jonesii]KAI8817186.1 hypothetical protein EV422DRAFT_258773 [Fimicolochytrium jonesii]
MAIAENTSTEPPSSPSPASTPTPPTGTILGAPAIAVATPLTPPRAIRAPLDIETHPATPPETVAHGLTEHVEDAFAALALAAAASASESKRRSSTKPTSAARRVRTSSETTDHDLHASVTSYVGACHAREQLRHHLLKERQKAELQHHQQFQSYRRWYLQRDSLARRLKVGKEGSRRRRRFDNDHFTDHPIVSQHKHDADFMTRGDLLPGLDMPRPPGVFARLPRKVLADLPTEGSWNAGKEENVSKEAAVGEANLTRLDRRLRSQIRRSASAREVVRMFEERILEKFVPLDGSPLAKSADENSSSSSSDEDSLDIEAEYEIIIREVDLPPSKQAAPVDSRPPVEETPVTVQPAPEPQSSPQATLCLEITNTFLRLIVHAMCRYYRLVSRSIDHTSGTRLTIIEHPLSVMSPLVSSSTTLKDVATHIQFPMPCRSFFDYVFA